MKFDFCPQETELAAALREGRWPQACDPALREHVAGCRHCSDVVLVTRALQQDRAQAIRTANPPPPGVLWWRAQLLRRNGAVERMTAPIAWAEKLAFFTTLLAGLALAAWLGHPGDWLRWLVDLPHSANGRWDTLWPSSPDAAYWAPLLLIAGLGTLGLFAGLAVYLATEKE